MSTIETPRFPDNVAYGALLGPEYRTEVVEEYSGAQQRNIAWDQGLLVFAVRMPLSDDQMAELTAWHRVCKGRAHAFRVRDRSDYRALEATNRWGRLGTSDNGTGVPAYQLTRKYLIGSLSEYRSIRKPVASPAVQIYRGGVLQTAGAGAGNYAIVTTTGVVTFVADSSSNVTAVTPGASTVVTLAGALSGLAIGGRLYLSGLGGTIGAALNSLAHPVSNVSGAIYTLSTVTTGLAWTSGGTGAKYAQPTEALHWLGAFDVACRFEDDRLGMRAEAPSRWTGEVRMREDRSA